jgi:hypothetical protein
VPFLEPNLAQVGHIVGVGTIFASGQTDEVELGAIVDLPDKCRSWSEGFVVWVGKYAKDDFLHNFSILKNA